MKIQELEAAAKAATPGPWIHDDARPGAQMVKADGSLVAAYPFAATERTMSDFAFIALANPAAILDLTGVAEEMAEALRKIESETMRFEGMAVALNKIERIAGEALARFREAAK